MIEVLYAILLTEVALAGALGLVLLAFWSRSRIRRLQHARRYTPIQSVDDLAHVQQALATGAPLPSAWREEPY